MRRNQTIMLAALVLVVSAALDAERCQAAAYIKFDGVDGESKDTGRRGWSDLTGFSLHVVAGGTRTAATMSNRFSMLADQSLPVLLDALVRGTDFSMVEVETTSPDGAEIYQYELTDARLADLAVTHDASGVGRVVGEILAPEVRILHVPTGNEMIWDFSTNSASALAPLSGDYDGDSDVDADDYAKWRDTYGAQMLNLGGGADGNADGRVDAADFTIWRDNYTGSNLFSPTAAPEPAAAALCVVALLGIHEIIRRHRQRPEGKQCAPWRAGATHCRRNADASQLFALRSAKLEASFVQFLFWKPAPYAHRW